MHFGVEDVGGDVFGFFYLVEFLPRGGDVHVAEEVHQVVHFLGEFVEEAIETHEEHFAGAEGVGLGLDEVVEFGAEGGDAVEDELV